MALAPFSSLYKLESNAGVNLPLPVELSDLYGQLQFPPHVGRPYVIANFVETLDGVVSLGIPGHSSGGEISGFNPHDRMMMGLLRATADAIIVGAGTLRAASPDYLWTAGYIFPELAEAYWELRNAMGKPEPPLNVIVTGSGEIDLSLRVFQSGEVPVLIVTTWGGGERLYKDSLPPFVHVVVVEDAVDGEVSACAVLDACRSHLRSCDIILLEGGPHLLGSFFADACLDELFLTLAPQLAGRGHSPERPTLIAGKSFAPEHPLWGTLAGVKQAGSHLFLRYSYVMPAVENGASPNHKKRHSQP
jgi:riboflavin biosynthesis pyrimidine reductase